MAAMFGVGMFELIFVFGILGGMAAAIVAVVFAATRRPGGTPVNNPNLHPCPDCGHFISVRAATCPHCGGPVKGT